MVSVIIPIYNPGNKLQKCLESLRTQSYHDIEVIMVNDGSKDDSASVCQRYAKSDSRFVYIEQANAGVSVARNNGIERATGEYLCFVDSDDSVASDYVGCMIRAMEDNHPDIVLQGAQFIKNGEVIGGDLLPNLVCEVHNLDDVLAYKFILFGCPYCKLYKSQIIKEYQVRFPQGWQYGEDIVFHIDYLMHCSRIVFLSEQHYYYSVAVEQSLSSQPLDPFMFWKVESVKRGGYNRMLNFYGLPKPFNAQENAAKIIGLKGLIGSVKHSGLDDDQFKQLLNVVLSDKDYSFRDTKPVCFWDSVFLKLIKYNNVITRKLLLLATRS